MKFRIERYDESRKQLWDTFVGESKNATFLFARDYMDYHRDRFVDQSILIWDDDKLLAILPANRLRDELVSHGGLSYGGLLLRREASLGRLVEAFPILLDHLRADGIRSFAYKAIPHIYHQAPAEEDRYCLFRNHARLYRSDVLTVIHQRHRAPYQERRARSIKRAKKALLDIRQTDDYAGFWEILATNLGTRYELKPVHSVEEIRLLASRFSANIRLFAAYQGETMRAGAVLFLSARVCHVQYNAADAAGKGLGAQDLLFHDLIDRYSISHDYFDFGVSTENEGGYLNAGLVDYKQGFGGQCVVHDFFRLDLHTQT